MENEFLMNTNNESTNNTQDAATVDPALQPAEQLRSCLNEPKSKDEAWQDQAGRSVSLLAVGFLNDPNNESALRSVALLGLAQSLGVKEARKRTIKLSRWAEIAPPSLSTLKVKDEQHAALRALAKLNTSWSRSYAEQALGDLSIPYEFVSELLMWARATYPDNQSFTKDFYAPQLAAAKSAERTLALIKDAAKLLKPTKHEAPAKLAEGLDSLVSGLLQSTQPFAVDRKIFLSNVAVLLNVVQDIAAAVPAVLLQPIFVSAVGRMTAVASKGAASKQVVTVTDALSLATISLLVADIERYGSQAASHWKAMVPTWRAAYPSWDAKIALAMVLAPALAALTAGSNQAPHESLDAYATEAVFARLLPAWDAFVTELPQANRVASLSAMLKQAAGTVGVVLMGEKGAVVSYDPLSHHLVAEGGESPRQVRIVRPGVQVQRPDGSVRVLVAALVAAA